MYMSQQHGKIIEFAERCTTATIR